jgi:hypothetical protein
VDVRSLGPIDGVDVWLSGLEPAETYTLYLTDGRGLLSGESWPLATMTTDKNGGAPLVEAVSAARLPIAEGSLVAGYRVVLVKGTTARSPIVLGSHA